MTAPQHLEQPVGGRPEPVSRPGPFGEEYSALSAASVPPEATPISPHRRSRPMARLAARARKAPWALRYTYGAGVASTVRRIALRVTHLHCHVEFQGPVRLGPGFTLHMPDGGAFVVGPGVEFRRGFVCEIRQGGRVEIGAGSVFTSNVLIQCSTSILIGTRCAFGQSSLVVDGSHRYADPDVHWLDQGYDHQPLVIGDGAGVSDKCTIQADIGVRALVASGSVVTRPVPPFCVAMGSPARVVRYFGPPEQRDRHLGPRPRTVRDAGADPPTEPGIDPPTRPPTDEEPRP